MNKQLEKLCDVYKSLDAKHLGKSSALSMLCKSRNKAYNSVIPVAKVEDIQEDVVAENLEFCELLAKVSSDFNLSKGAFENVMTIISNMNKTSFGLLDEDNQMQVLEGEIGIVRGIFKELKQNPHKAGIKIKSIRFAMNSLNDQKEDLIEKIGAEKEETSEVIKNEDITM